MADDELHHDQPPPYTPRDPHAVPPSPPARTSPAGTPPPVPEDLPTLGGRGRGDSVVTSPTAFFEERLFTRPEVPALMVLENDIHPALTRDELQLPLSEQECTLRELTAHDWDTFVNFLLAQLKERQWSSDGDKTEHWGGMTPEEFYRCKVQMERTVKEWNDGYFMPRGIHFNAKYSFSSPDAAGPSRQVDDINATGSPVFSTASTAFAYPGMLGPPALPPANVMLGHPWTGPHLPGMPLPGQGSSLQGRTLVSSGRSRSLSSASSLSSVSSASTVSTLSSDCLSDVDLDQVRNSLAQFRLDPDHGSEMKAAVKGLNRDLKKHRLDRQQRTARRNLLSDPKEKAEYKSLKAAARGDLQDLNKEIKAFNQHQKMQVRQARQERQALRQQRRREHAEAKRQRRAQRRGSHRHDEGGGDALSRSSTDAMAHEPSVETPTLTRESSVGGGSTLPHYNMPHFAGPPVDLKQLSKTDRKLEQAARGHDQHANHWARVVGHWEGQIAHWAAAWATQEGVVSQSSARRDAHLAELVTRTPAGSRRDRLSQQRAKEAERAAAHTLKRTQHAEKNRSKLAKQVHKAARTMADYADKAAETRARMEWQPDAQGRGEGSSAGGAQPGDAPGGYAGRVGKGLESWGSQFGRDMEAWGERYGRQMEQWGEQFGRDMEARGSNFGKRVEIWSDKISK